MPRRMSVTPAASHTRTPDGTGIIRASTDSTRASAASSTPASTNTRYPFGVTTSIRLGAGARSARSSTTTAGTKPLGAAATSVPARYALRQANSNEVEIPCRRAVADARRQPAKLSSTIRSFASLVQRRRRPSSTTSSR